MTMAGVGILLAAFVALIVAVLISAVKFQFVEEGNEVVIFRLGRFLRVDGPGMVRLFRHTDAVKYTLDKREKPYRVYVSERFRYVPVDVTFVVWGRTDLRTAAEISGVPLNDLAVFSDSERERRLQLMVLSAVRRAMRDAERDVRDKAPRELGYLQDLLPLLPGLPPSVRLADELARELADTLPTIGVVLSTRHRIDILQVSAPDDIADNIMRDRTIRLLRSTFPALDEDVIVQALTALEDKDMPQIKHITLDGTAVSAQFDTAWDEDRYRFRSVGTPRQTPRTAGRPAVDESSEEPSRQDKSPNGVEELTPEDLDILKPLPMYPQKRAP